MSGPPEPTPRRARERERRRRALVVRRRRVALGGLAALAAVTGAVLGSGGDDAGSPTAGSSEEAAAGPPPPSCAAPIADDDARLAGQLLMVRMEGVATADLLRRARRGELGGVVLFPVEGADPAEVGAEVERLRQAARKGGFPEPLVAIDQEGGEVKRFPAEPPEIAPVEIDDEGGPELAREEGLATGRALARLGIDVDLAPVLDVPVEGGFMASRAFSERPERAAELGLAFADGLAAGGVAATAKHFPGLGRAVANTDFEASAVDATRGALERDLVPFEAAIAADIPLVMVANAEYPAYDGALPASLSPRVVERLLREQLGYDGVVITDDLGAVSIAGAGYDESAAALAAVDSGVDVVLLALSDGSAAATALERGARRSPKLRERMLESCARLTALRARLDQLATSSASP